MGRLKPYLVLVAGCALALVAWLAIRNHGIVKYYVLEYMRIFDSG